MCVVKGVEVFLHNKQPIWNLLILLHKQATVPFQVILITFTQIDKSFGSLQAYVLFHNFFTLNIWI